MKKYKFLYNGNFGEVVATRHVIDYTIDAKTVQKCQYRTGSGIREVVAYHFTKKLNHGIIEPANTPWYLPVMSATKKGVIFGFCVDLGRISLIILRDSYPLPHVNECIDRIGDSKFLSALY